MFHEKIFIQINKMQYMIHYRIQTHHKCHIIATKRHNKHYSSYIIKTVNPFSPLWPLTSHIKHTERHKKTAWSMHTQLHLSVHHALLNIIFTDLMMISFILKWVSIIPFVRTLARSTSVGVGTYFSLQILSMFSNKLLEWTQFRQRNIRKG
jgi:hypothetical protein